MAMEINGAPRLMIVSDLDNTMVVSSLFLPSPFWLSLQIQLSKLMTFMSSSSGLIQLPSNIPG